MAITVIRIEPSGAHGVLEVGDGGPSLREAVGCQWLASVRLTPADRDPGGDDLMLWFDDEGADNGSEPNALAGALGSAVTGAQVGPFLGVVLVSGLADPEGDTRGLTPAQVAEVATLLTGAAA